MYYLDANILIEYLRNPSSNIMDSLKSIPLKNVKIPAIVKGELMVGAHKRKNVEQSIKDVEKLTSFFEIVPFDDEASKIYGLVHAELESRGKSIGSNDLLIASIVLSRGGILVTDNTKEFSNIKELRLENWKK